MIRIETVGEDDFVSKVVEEKTFYVLVEFFTEGMDPDSEFTRNVQRLHRDHGHEMKILRLSVDAHDDFSRDFDVMSLPCCILFERGQELFRFIGNTDYEEMELGLKPYFYDESRAETI